MNVEQGTNANGDRTITVTIGKDEDPQGHLYGFVIRDRLETLLKVLATPGEYGWIKNEFDMAYVLTRFGYMANLCVTVRDGLMVSARNDHGMGWGRIADLLEQPRQTTKARIQRRDPLNEVMERHLDSL